jgi:hypothetical protein
MRGGWTMESGGGGAVVDPPKTNMCEWNGFSQFGYRFSSPHGSPLTLKLLLV